MVFAVGVVTKHALASRALVLAVSLSTPWIGPCYDLSGDSCLPPGKISTFPAPLGDRWDAVHMAAIARVGYDSELRRAFFPLFPWAMRWLGGALSFLGAGSIVGEETCRLIAGILIANVSFVLAARSLERLTRSITGDARFARAAGVCFAWTPAGVFMSSCYTESPFALASFLAFERAFHGRWIGFAGFAGFASLLRSNGAVNAGHAFVAAVAEVWRPPRCTSSYRRLGSIAVAALGAILPVAVVQWRAGVSVCAAYPERPYCQAWGYMGAYTSLQGEYWGNGFLRYYRSTEAGNFALATPVMVVTGVGTWVYLRSVWWPRVALWWAETQSSVRDSQTHPSSSSSYSSSFPSCSYFLISSAVRIAYRACHVVSRAVDCYRTDAESSGAARIQHEKKNAGRPRDPSQVQSPQANDAAAAADDDDDDGHANHGWKGPAAVAHVVQCAALALAALLFMNVQVATRFLSGSPALYWFLAEAIAGRNRHRWTAALVSTWCAVYTLVGTILFARYLPWT